MKIRPDSILPSQDFLKPDTIKYILERIRASTPDRLPPVPIVRENKIGKFVAIDGHNLLAVKAYLDEEIEVYLAKSSTDGLPEISEANKTRNINLKAKYDSVLAEQERVQAEGIGSFRDLI